MKYFSGMGLRKGLSSLTISSYNAPNLLNEAYFIISKKGSYNRHYSHTERGRNIHLHHLRSRRSRISSVEIPVSISFSVLPNAPDLSELFSPRHYHHRRPYQCRTYDSVETSLFDGDVYSLCVGWEESSRAMRLDAEIRKM